MKYLALSFILLLAFGCISQGERTIYENGTGQVAPGEGNPVEPPPPVTENASEPALPQESRYQAGGFSFIYPDSMEIEESRGEHSGIFSGSHVLAGGQTGELFLVSYMDTYAVYGANQDKIFKDDPTTAASDLLEEDMEDDPVAGLLSSAYEVGETSTFAIARDGIVAEKPFRIRFGDSEKSYSGYAMDLYIPERSLHAKVRILALDGKQAESIRDAFLLGFRLE